MNFHSVIGSIGVALLLLVYVLVQHQEKMEKGFPIIHWK
jgi:hypothetical protein